MPEKHNFQRLTCLLLSIITVGLIADEASGQVAPSDISINHDEIKILYKRNKESGYRILDAVAIIDAEPEDILRIIVDYEHFSEFMPRVKSTEVFHHTSDSARYLSNVVMPWPLSDIWYELAVSIDTLEYTTKWRMIRGSILDTKGGWTITKESKGTRVIYHVEALLDSSFPEFAIKIAQKKTVKDIMKAVRNRTRSAIQSR